METFQKKWGSMKHFFLSWSGKRVEKAWGKVWKKGGNVDCRPYLLVCQRSIANLRTSNEGGWSRTSSKIEGQGSMDYISWPSL